MSIGCGYTGDFTRLTLAVISCARVLIRLIRLTRVWRVRLHRDFLLGVSFRTFGGRCWEYVRCGEETIVKNTPWPVTDVMELGAMWG